MRAKVSSSPPIASATTTAASFADLVTSARIASSTERVWPGSSPSLEGACCEAWSETSSRESRPQLAGFDLLEQQIERHDLGERGRMPQRVGVGGVQHAARIGVDHDRRIGRIVGAARATWWRLRRPRASAGSVLIAVSAMASASVQSPKRRPSASRIARSMVFPVLIRWAPRDVTRRSLFCARCRKDCTAAFEVRANTRVGNSGCATPATGLPHRCGTVANGRGNVIAKRLSGCTALMLTDARIRADIAVQKTP